MESLKMETTEIAARKSFIGKNIKKALKSCFFPITNKLQPRKRSFLFSSDD